MSLYPQLQDDSDEEGDEDVTGVVKEVKSVCRGACKIEGCSGLVERYKCCECSVRERHYTCVEMQYSTTGKEVKIHSRCSHHRKKQKGNAPVTITSRTPLARDHNDVFPCHQNAIRKEVWTTASGARAHLWSF
jgi:hypothetical protein